MTFQDCALMNPMMIAVHQHSCETTRQDTKCMRWPGGKSVNAASAGSRASRRMRGISMIPFRLSTRTAASFTSVIGLVNKESRAAGALRAGVVVDAQIPWRYPHTGAQGKGRVTDDFARR